MFFIFVFLFVQPVRSQSMGVAARKAIQQMGSDYGCLVNGSPSNTDRLLHNALIWKMPMGDWGAFVTNSDVPSVSASGPPCWGTPGHCAVYEGDLPNFSPECSPVKQGVRRAFAKEILHIYDYKAYGSTVMRGSEGLLRLARGLTAKDTIVSIQNRNEFYMSALPDGSRRTRILAGSDTFFIARMRNSLKTLENVPIQEFARKLGSVYLELIGPDGAVSKAGLMVYKGKCVELTTFEEFRARLVVAEDILPMSGVPAKGAETEAVWRDLVQTIVGSDVVYGPEIMYKLDQDPMIYLAKSGESTKCPG